MNFREEYLIINLVIILTLVFQSKSIGKNTIAIYPFETFEFSWKI